VPKWRSRRSTKRAASASRRIASATTSTPVAAYYKEFASRPERDRQVARAQAYEALAKKYPTDDEAQIFAALYVAGTQTQADQTYGAYLKAAAVLEDEFRKYPDHPGVAHYLIHSYDAPPIANKGLTAARRYATIAPSAPHALHMPSHIFTRTGDWPESAATNLRSRDVAIAGNEPDEAYHASDYMVYAYLQLARDADARRAIDAAMKVEGASTRFVAPYAIASMPARYAFERRAWQEAANLKPIGSTYPFVESITYFARSVGAARSGDLAAARKDAEQLEKLHKALLDAKNAYWAAEVEVQRLAAAGWIALGEGKTDEGAQVHARGGRSRGQEREAHRHAGSHRSGARAPGRHAAGGEASRTSHSWRSRLRSSASPIAIATMSAPRAPRSSPATARKRRAITRSC
jgi:hypothetical protein